LEIQILIGIFAVGITILVVALWLLYARFNQQPQGYRWLAYTLSFSFSCDMLSVVIRIFGGNSNIGGTLYSIGFVIFFSAFFYQILRGKILLGVLTIVNACFLVFVLYNATFVQKLTINSYSNIIGSGIILALCILYYFKLLRDLPAERVYNLPLFWVVSAFFFTKSGKFVLYLVIQYLRHLEDNLVILWMIHNSLTIIENLLITYGAWLQYKSIQHQPKLS
jgi:hypothetical protein